jgi:Holliday junction resolvase RusA-like endonuclease
MLTFDVPGEPQPLARAKVRVIAGRPSVYQPKRNRELTALIRQCAAEAMGRAGYANLIEGPLAITVRCWMDWPLSKRVKRPERINPQRLASLTRPTAKNDVDNLLAAVMNACTKTVYRDDGQIVTASLEKRYTSQRPHTEIAVYPVPPDMDLFDAPDP